MFLFVVVVVVAFLHNIFSQYRGQICNRKPFYVSFIKLLKGIMLNGWILFSFEMSWAFQVRVRLRAVSLFSVVCRVKRETRKWPRA